MQPDLSVNLCGKKLKNPLILASGILGDTVHSLKSAVNCGLGGVVSKSTSWKPRKGHPKPWLVKIDNIGFLNAVGLANVGIEKEIEKLIRLRKLTLKKRPIIIASVFGPTIKDIAQLAKLVEKAKPDFIEVNASCPHVDSTVKGSFYNSPQAIKRLTEAVKRKASTPIIIKLSPNVENISLIAKAVEKGGADAISAINTLGPGMKIDIKTGRTVLGNKIGGMSGPAVKPIAVRCVYQIAQTVKVPIIGMGGITTGEDALEMIMAGASALGVGSAFYLKGKEVFENILDQMKELMIKYKIKSLKEIKGKVFC